MSYSERERAHAGVCVHELPPKHLCVHTPVCVFAQTRGEQTPSLVHTNFNKVNSGGEKRTDRKRGAFSGRADNPVG